MAEYEKYMLSKPAEWIDEVFKGAVVGTKAMPELSEQFKAQFRDNIGATSSDASWQPKGYFATFEELQATITAPEPGDAYGVGLEPPYNIWVWDGLRGRWLNNGPIKGMDGKDGKDGEDGKDAEVTAESIQNALGFAPLSPAQMNEEFTATLFAAAWDGLQQSVSLPGLPEKAVYTVDLNTEGITDADILKTLDAAWKPLKVTFTGENATVIFSEMPTVDLPMKVWAARKG